MARPPAADRADVTPEGIALALAITLAAAVALFIALVFAPEIAAGARKVAGWLSRSRTSTGKRPEG